MAAGPPDGITYANVKTRLAKVIGHIVDAEAAHEQVSRDVASERVDQVYQDQGPGPG